MLLTSDVAGTEGGLGFGDLTNGTMGETLSNAWRLKGFRLTEPGGTFTVSAESVAAAFVRLNGTDWQYDTGSGWSTFSPSNSVAVIGRLTTDGTQISAASITVPQRLNNVGTTIEPKARVDFIQQRQRFVTSEDTAVQTRHKLAREAEVSSLLDSSADATTENARQFALLDSKWDLYRVPIRRKDAEDFRLKLGDTVTPKLNRFGLSSGRDIIIGGMATGSDADELILTLWG